MVFVVVTFHGGLLECSVHALDLAICPRMIDPGEAMFDVVLGTDTIEDVQER